MNQLTCTSPLLCKLLIYIQWARATQFVEVRLIREHLAGPCQKMPKHHLGRFLWEQNLVQKSQIFRQDFRAVEDFVKRSLWGKNLVDGEILCLGMISEYLYMLFFAGDTKFKLPKAGNGNVFFPNKRVEVCKSRQSCSSTVPQPVKHRHQHMWRFYPRGHRW